MSFAGIRLRGLRKYARPVSRIDKRKTRVNALEQLLDDSDEGSFSSRSSDASDSGLSYNESDDASESSDSFQPPKKKTVGADLGESDEERCVTSFRRRKRSACILNERDDSTDSTESNDGGEPVRKAKQKKRQKLSDSEDESNLEREKETKIQEAAAKRKERKSKLVELLKQRKTASARRRRRTLGSEQEEEAENVEPEGQCKAEDSSENDSSEEHPVHLIDSSEEEKQADSDSLKDFIVEDEEQKEEDEEVIEGETANKDFFTHLPREFITGSQFTHFQVVIKALLINALDTSFLQSLYDGERTKRYAKEMKSSLHYFDERLVLPRLENLKQRSRWKERYKERVECYPKVRVIMVNVRTRNCEACELHRNGRFRVHLSGQLYHCTTLQEDQFMPDDSQTFLVGSVCASRTEVYHALKHYKYHLYVRCRTALKDHKEAGEEAQEVDDDEPVKDTVKKLFTKLQEDGWITRQYEEFEECLNKADFFQEEKLD